MKRSAPFKLLLGLLFAGSLSANAQDTYPFANEINAFNRQDSLTPPPAKPVLFVGSSSIRLWPTLQEYFPGAPVLNRGFGGATIPNLVHYAEQTIYRYNPSKIIFYCGENDFAESDTVGVQTVVQRFTDIFLQIRKRLPNVPFVFISIKPSPSRAHLMEKMKEANAEIRSFLKKHRNTQYVDVYSSMLNEQGRPRPELFTADSLHMNRQGYDLWTSKLKPLIR